MKRMNLRKYLNVAVWIGGSGVTTSALADMHQGGYGMMGMGGYGGIWLPILLIAVIAGFMGWVIGKKRK
ncbi:hypothetical protein [Leucothrix arctica]|uniref:Uncharacterized protein n=1 Tax=Leucothrix arctica TaxID=1481894 RepID=A0A317C6K0_9GAMM|nr:hypothetical protein [Leucothrix arctica]PWQ93821.1 hypothetical protein DKT75_19655 [Leucothrix arctica]